jgi:glycyl-tRNA synthetase beta chain
LAYELADGEGLPSEVDIERKGMAWISVQSVGFEVIATKKITQDVLSLPTGSELSQSVVAFIADRLKVALREKGTRHDLIDAVFSFGSEDDLVRLVARVEALQSFLKTDEGANLLAGYKRAVNILKAEEKKDGKFEGEVDAKLLSQPEEKALAEALVQAETSIAADVKAEKFVEAMGVMAKLRAPVDAFFDKVKVNDADASVRENRLKLLSRLRATLHQVADFSKIEG